MPRWTLFTFILTAWMLGVIIGGMIEETTLGGEEVTLLQALVTFNIVQINYFHGVIPYPWPNGEWFSALGAALAWDFALFEGPWSQYIKWAFWGVSGGIMIVMAGWLLSLIRGT